MDTRLKAVRPLVGAFALLVGVTASAAEISRPDPIQPAAPPSQNQTPGSQEPPRPFTPPQAPPPAGPRPEVTQQPPTQPQPRTQFPRPLAPPAPVKDSRLEPRPLQAPSTSTAAAPTPTPAPLPSPAAPSVPAPQFPGPFNNPSTSDRPFITDLEGNRRQSEQRFNAQMQERRQTFEQRQKDDAAAFKTTLEGKGFFERRRLSNEFNAEQGRKRKAFNEEDDARRKKTEWRFE